MKQWAAPIVFSLLIISINAAGQLPQQQNLDSRETWLVVPNGTELKFFFDDGENVSQYGALHLMSSYFRLVYGPASGWGTSIILLPVFWREGGKKPDQGAPINATWKIVGRNLILYTNGMIAGLNVSSEVTISPPANNIITAIVETKIIGNVTLAVRPEEAFKPIMLSSMHISATMWDTQAAYAGSKEYPLPNEGWIISPQTPLVTRVFGLIGGTSEDKKNQTIKGIRNTPNIQIELDRPMQVTGWVNRSIDRNDDNVGYWASSDNVLPSWSYRIIVSGDH